MYIFDIFAENQLFILVTSPVQSIYILFQLRFVNRLNSNKWMGGFGCPHGFKFS